MEIQKVNILVGGMIAFSAFLAGWFALVYYSYQIQDINPLQTIVISEVYIVANLGFLYMLQRWLE